MRAGPSSMVPIPTARPVARLPLNMSSIRAIDLSVKPTGRMHALHVGEHREFSTARASGKSPDRDRAAWNYGCTVHSYDPDAAAGVLDRPRSDGDRGCCHRGAR